ncbi:penicillin acylase family protein [Nocardioides caeni]|uniref:Penicillin acylase family protein n=1 Tax=Nocardioides caeni TaxID=574700 RepID=A0A4S8N0H9_9ACTN|nr:penicillin acylase family protein [Nocardioides caeni]THV08961.1 penicillin acylase family protein [Nocardioides caeni]
MSITRDRWGIPTVVAGSLLEVARAQGRAMAADRAGQLELERRRAEGTCAEVYGAAALEWDVFARRAQLVRTAQRAHAALSGESVAFFGAYVEGLNEVLDRDRRWEAWTPLAVFAVQHVLFSGFPSQLWRRHLAASAAAEWLPLFRHEGLPGGSNAFVVAGSRTASGLPLIAGDPHRIIEAPNCYAQVRLVCTDPADSFDVAGFTFPGLPGVQHFAHAGEVAWAITNAVADDEDIRPVVAGDMVRRERTTVRVRQDDGSLQAIDIELAETDHGPVVLHDAGEDGEDGEDGAASYSLRSPSWVLGDLGLDAVVDLLRSRSADDVTAAFGRWVGPVNNLLVADRGGVVEHRVVGRVPQRDADRRWTGWVEDLPRRTGDVLVTANHRATTEFSRIGSDFAPPHRARRIEQLLAERLAEGPLAVDAAAAVLADDRQNAGTALLDLVGSLTGLGPAATALRDRLLVWDRSMAVGSVDAARFAEVRAAVVDAFAAAPALAGLDGSPHGELFAPWFDLRGRVRLCLPNLLAADRPFGLDPRALVAAALEEVAAGPDPAPWGEWHVVLPLTPHHQFGLPLPDGLPAAPSLPVPGDDDCVLATKSLGGRGPCVQGPVARYVFDLAGDSRWVVPLGAAGEPADPHHHDQQAVWVAGGVLPLERHDVRPQENP